MQVNAIKINYKRTRQAAQYEPVASEVEYHATLDDGEDHLKVTHSLFADAQIVVHQVLGIASPNAKAPTPIATNEPVTPPTSEPEQESPAARLVRLGKAIGADPLKGVRGANADELKKLLVENIGLRDTLGWCSQFDRLPKAMRDEFDAVEETPAAEEAPAIRTSPEDRQPPAAEGETPTKEDVQAACKNAAAVIGGAKVKEIVATFGVTQTASLPEGERANFIAKLDEAVEAAKADDQY